MDQQHLNLKIMECVSDPVKCRLLIETLKSGEACADIPQTTQYRNLKPMTEDGVLRVAGETQLRGTDEKMYAVAFDLNDANAMTGENAAAYRQGVPVRVPGFIRQAHPPQGAGGGIVERALRPSAFVYGLSHPPRHKNSLASQMRRQAVRNFCMSV